ncbi:hypothetical protein [Treponema sp.]|uniref:hypothetical protein n=1 Tax=Treponema sp. TaxID=166 RepID=UPI003F10913B
MLKDYDDEIEIPYRKKPKFIIMAESYRCSEKQSEKMELSRDIEVTRLDSSNNPIEDVKVCLKEPDRKRSHFINGGVDRADAKEIAAAFLMQSSFKFQTVRAKCEGNYRIKPGNRLAVKYLGEMFSGEYLIKFVTHTFDILNGYRTECGLMRNCCETSRHKGYASEIDSEMVRNRTKNPQILNSRWEKDGKPITKALVGDEVMLCADVTDLDDGATATIKIVEKDDDGSCDYDEYLD